MKEKDRQRQIQLDRQRHVQKCKLKIDRQNNIERLKKERSGGRKGRKAKRTILLVSSDFEHHLVSGYTEQPGPIC